MRRVQIYLDEGIDDALASEAVKIGMSKAALIRRLVAQGMGAELEGREDPLAGLIGRYAGEPGDIDKVVYG
ncbi:MAG: antitoxin [Chloroflexi bacterium]|nr:MAG: antitoxin [Chloroflexota bacterium]